MEIAKSGAVEVAAVVVGSAIGGPWGALAGAAITPLLSVISQGDQRQLRNVIRLGEAVRELTGLSEEEFAAWTSDRDDRLALVTAAIRAAHATFYDRKIESLARVVAENVDDDTHLDVSRLIIAALSELEAPHVQVLNAICRDTPPPHATDTVAPGAWALSQLQQHLPGLANGILPIAATLTRLGMMDSSVLAAQDGPCWEVTQFAHQCVAYLVDVGDKSNASRPA